MFAARYFAPRYFARRYWPKVGAAAAAFVVHSALVRIFSRGARAAFAARSARATFSEVE